MISCLSQLTFHACEMRYDPILPNIDFATFVPGFGMDDLFIYYQLDSCYYV